MSGARFYLSRTMAGKKVDISSTGNMAFSGDFEAKATIDVYACPNPGLVRVQVLDKEAQCSVLFTEEELAQLVVEADLYLSGIRAKKTAISGLAHVLKQVAKVKDNGGVVYTKKFTSTYAMAEWLDSVQRFELECQFPSPKFAMLMNIQSMTVFVVLVPPEIDKPKQPAIMQL